MPNPTQSIRDQVVTWLRKNDQTVSSFDRIISNLEGIGSYDQLSEMVYKNSDTFRAAKIRGGLRGLVMFQNAPAVQPEEQLQLTDVQVAPLETPVAAEAPVTLVIVDDPIAEKTSVDYLKSLIKKAAEEPVSGAAVNYSQAALNVATALVVLKSNEIEL